MQTPLVPGAIASRNRRRNLPSQDRRDRIGSPGLSDDPVSRDGYSPHTLRQSSRCSWRIGQRRPVEVQFFAYKGTMQEVCLRLMGEKLLVALAREGKFASEGLQAIDGDDDMLTAMARELVEDKGIGESADSVWRSLQQLRPSASSPVGEEALVTATDRADAGLPEALTLLVESVPNSAIGRAPLLPGHSSRSIHEAEQLPLF